MSVTLRGFVRVAVAVVVDAVADLVSIGIERRVKVVTVEAD